MAIKFKVPSAINFIRWILLSLLFTFIPLYFAITYNSMKVLLVVSIIYFILFTFKHKITPNKRNDILFKFISPILGLFWVFIIFSLDFNNDLNKAILNLIKENKLYLLIVFVSSLNWYIILKTFCSSKINENNSIIKF